MRVQIPAYTDRWMMGDRYGKIVQIKPATSTQRLKMKPVPRVYETVEIAHVKLDKSGKTVRVLLTDCQEV